MRYSNNKLIRNTGFIKKIDSLLKGKLCTKNFFKSCVANTFKSKISAIFLAFFFVFCWLQTTESPQKLPHPPFQLYFPIFFKSEYQSKNFKNFQTFHPLKNLLTLGCLFILKFSKFNLILIWKIVFHTLADNNDAKQFSALRYLFRICFKTYEA